MGRVSSLFTDTDHQQITQAVSSAEQKSAVEIVPVVAGSSGRYDRPEDLVGLWTAVLCVTLAWILIPLPDTTPNAWGGTAPVWQLIILLVALIVGFVIGTGIGIKSNRLRRMFTPKRQMQDEVWRRARETFYDQRVHHTTKEAGLLIYVSLFEHQAVILADQQVLTHIEQSLLNEICTELTSRLKTEPLTDSLVHTIESVGNKLEGKLPAPASNWNELADVLVVLEEL